MKLLGLDYGEKRIGVATGTSSGFSTPLCVVVNNAGALSAIIKIISEQRVNKVVLGLPLHKDGTENANCVVIRELGARIERESGVSVDYHNELLSSWEAEEYIKEHMGVKNRDRIKEMLDKVAASMILNDYVKEKHGKNCNNG